MVANLFRDSLGRVVYRNPHTGRVNALTLEAARRLAPDPSAVPFLPGAMAVQAAQPAPAPQAARVPAIRNQAVPSVDQAARRVERAAQLAAARFLRGAVWGAL